jgi:hypothetical protein
MGYFGGVWGVLQLLLLRIFRDFGSWFRVYRWVV